MPVALITVRKLARPALKQLLRPPCQTLGIYLDHRPCLNRARLRRYEPRTARSTAARPRAHTHGSSSSCSSTVPTAGNCRSASRSTNSSLHQVPFVAAKIDKHDHPTISFFAGLCDEFDTALLHGVVVAPEVVGVQKQENASARLVADAAFLFRAGRVPTAGRCRPIPAAAPTPTACRHPRVCLRRGQIRGHWCSRRWLRRNLRRRWRHERWFGG